MLSLTVLHFVILILISLTETKKQLVPDEMKINSSEIFNKFPSYAGKNAADPTYDLCKTLADPLQVIKYALADLKHIMSINCPPSLPKNVAAAIGARSTKFTPVSPAIDRYNLYEGQQNYKKHAHNQRYFLSQKTSQYPIYKTTYFSNQQDKRPKSRFHRRRPTADTYKKLTSYTQTPYRPTYYNKYPQNYKKNPGYQYPMDNFKPTKVVGKSADEDYFYIDQPDAQPYPQQFYPQNYYNQMPYPAFYPVQSNNPYQQYQTLNYDVEQELELQPAVDSVSESHSEGHKPACRLLDSQIKPSSMTSLILQAIRDIPPFGDLLEPLLTERRMNSTIDAGGLKKKHSNGSLVSSHGQKAVFKFNQSSGNLNSDQTESQTQFVIELDQAESSSPSQPVAKDLVNRKNCCSDVSTTPRSYRRHYNNTSRTRRPPGSSTFRLTENVVKHQRQPLAMRFNNRRLRNRLSSRSSLSNTTDTTRQNEPPIINYN